MEQRAADAVLPPPPLDLLDGASLFLDFDGTLVELAPRPDAVSVSDALGALMRRLADRVAGRLAIVSGRSVEQIDALFADPGLIVGGSHGLELRWSDGRHHRPERAPSLDGIVAEMERLQAEHPGIVIENKPYSAAIHYRQVPEAEQACIALTARLAAESGLPLQPGKMMLELRAAGADKGGAIRAFMADPTMAGTRPIFLGDDETDEHGFVAAAELGGAGILIGPARRSAALFRLDDVTEALAWLDAASREAA